MLKTIATTALAIALQAMTMATTAQAAQVCTEVTRPNGTTALACKNVPDNPAPSNSQATPTPTPSEPRPTAPAANTPAAPIAASEQPQAATAAQLATLRKQAFAGNAQAAALAPIAPSSVGKTTLTLAGSSFGGYSAFGLSVTHRPAQNLLISAGVSASSANPASNLVRISAGFEF